MTAHAIVLEKVTYHHRSPYYDWTCGTAGGKSRVSRADLKGEHTHTQTHTHTYTHTHTTTHQHTRTHTHRSPLTGGSGAHSACMPSHTHVIPQLQAMFMF